MLSLAERLRSAGLEVSTFEVDDRRIELIVRLDGTGEGPLCLCGHLDTVPPGDVGRSFDPLAGEVGAGMLLGRVRPSHGRNAISAAARAILSLEGLELRSDPDLGSSTLNVGRVEGGRAPDVVSDRAVVEVDVRTVTGESAGSWVERLEQISGEDAEVSVELDLPPVGNDSTDPRLEPLLRQLGLSARGAAVPYFTDASLLGAELGAAVLIWGPGDPALAHAPDECCDVEEIAEMASRLARLGPLG
ncbi:MAG: peptidase dimerization domain-containing protein [Solirubrobacterales bacterium]